MSLKDDCVIILLNPIVDDLFFQIDFYQYNKKMHRLFCAQNTTF